MIIDAHAHVSGPAVLGEHFREVAGMAPGVQPQPIEISDEAIEESLKGHLADVASVGTDFQIIMTRPGVIPTALRRETAVMYMAQEVNNLFARFAQLHPDRFVALATLPQVVGVSPKNCAEELERCVKELGFVGAKINPDPGEGGVQSPDMGEEYWYPLYEKLVELDIPGMLHGGPYRYSREPELSYYLAEVTIGAWALLRTPKVFKDFPNLKIIVGHGGGYVPYQLGRARAYRLNEMARDLSVEPLEQTVRRLYWDTVLYTTEALDLMFRMVGVDNCLFGSDRPSSTDVVNPETGRPMNDIKPYIEAIPWLTESDRRKIFEENALKLFTRLKVPA